MNTKPMRNHRFGEVLCDLAGPLALITAEMTSFEFAEAETSTVLLSDLYMAKWRR